MRLVGLDVALLNTGLVIIDTNFGPEAHILHKTIKTGGKAARDESIFDRQLSVVKQIKPYIKKGDLFVLEDFGEAGRLSSSSRQLGPRLELQGMIRLLAYYWCKTKSIDMIPRKVKQFAFGKVEATKPQVVYAIKKNWRIPIDDHHQADAATLAVFGLGCWLSNQNKLDEEFTLKHFFGSIAFTKKQIKIVEAALENGVSITC